MGFSLLSFQALIIKLTGVGVIYFLVFRKISFSQSSMQRSGDGKRNLIHFLLSFCCTGNGTHFLIGSAEGSPIIFITLNFYIIMFTTNFIKLDNLEVPKFWSWSNLVRITKKQQQLNYLLTLIIIVNIKFCIACIVIFINIVIFTFQEALKYKFNPWSF